MAANLIRFPRPPANDNCPVPPSPAVSALRTERKAA